MTTEELDVQCVEYDVFKNTPIIYLYGRDSEGRRKCLSFRYRPYLFLEEKDATKEVLGTMKGVLSVEKGFTGLSGEALVKLTTNLPFNVRLAKKTLEGRGLKTYEADVYSFTFRWMVDNNVFSTWPPKPSEVYPGTVSEDRTKVFYVDIETLDSKIILVSYSNGTLPPTTIGSKSASGIDVQVSSETEVLQKFLEAWLREDPDVVIGWNINFDMETIIKRMEANDLVPALMSPMRKVIITKPRSGLYKGKSSTEKNISIGGREIFDLSRGYRDFFKKEIDVSWMEALDKVSKRHLGHGKVELKYEDFPEIWEKEPSKLAAYNKMDVQLLVELENKLKVFHFFNWLRRIAGVRLDDVWYKKRLVDSGLFRLSKTRLPSSIERPEEEFEGAHREAVPGIYSSFILLDFRSFYPSVILRYNISPETLDPNGDLVIDENHRFSSKQRGILPILLTALLREKDRLKEELDRGTGDEAVYNAIKYLVNSVYGLLGHTGSRLYNKKCAEAVTQKAREEIVRVKELLQAKGYPVMYLDTDSLGFEFNGTEDELVPLTAYLNSNLDGLVLEKRDHFKKVIVSTKCRYIGLDYKGQRTVKGMPLMRSDIPTYFSASQDKLCTLILGEEASKEEVTAIVKKAIKEMQDQTLLDLGVPKGLRKASADYKVKSYHIVATERTKKQLGVSFKTGDKPRILPTLDKERYIAIKEGMTLPSTIKVDYDKLRKHLVTILKPIYSFLDIKDEDVMEVGTQTRLLSVQKKVVNSGKNTNNKGGKNSDNNTS